MSYHRTDALPDNRSYRVDFSRLARMAPAHGRQVSLERSIRYLVDGLRAARFSEPQFRETLQIRLKVLANMIAAGAAFAGIAVAGGADRTHHKPS